VEHAFPTKGKRGHVDIDHLEVIFSTLSEEGESRKRKKGKEPTTSRVKIGWRLIKGRKRKPPGN